MKYDTYLHFFQCCTVCFWCWKKLMLPKPMEILKFAFSGKFYKLTGMSGTLLSITTTTTFNQLTSLQLIFFRPIICFWTELFELNWTELFVQPNIFWDECFLTLRFWPTCQLAIYILLFAVTFFLQNLTIPENLTKTWGKFTDPLWPCFF